MVECADCSLCHKASLGAVAPIECSCGTWHNQRPRPKPREKQRFDYCEDPAVRLFVLHCLKVWLYGPRTSKTLVWGGLESNFAAMLRFAELGWVGDGNSGTKGVGRKQRDWTTPLDVAEIEQYLSLLAKKSSQLKQTIELVQLDGRGFVRVPAVIDGVVLGGSNGLSLEQRIGLRIVRNSQTPHVQSAYVNTLLCAMHGDQRPLIDLCERYASGLLNDAAYEYKEILVKVVKN